MENPREMEEKRIGIHPEQTELRETIYTALLRKERGTATEELAKYILNDNQIYTTRDDEKTEVWIYKEGIYLPQGKTFIKETCRLILEEVYTTQITTQVIAKIEADTFIEPEKFFKNNYINEIAVKNGILNTKTNELTEFTPNKIFFNKLPIKYNPKAKCPNIIKHLKTVLRNEEDIKVMEEFLGYLIHKALPIEKAMICFGWGRNGKGKTLQLMENFLGAENCVHFSINQLETDQWAASECMNKMANVCGDMSKTALKKSSVFKKLTGRDSITASRKFLRPVNFNNYSKMIFSTNELPIVYDNSEGFWSRWIYFDFPYKFVPELEYNQMSKEEKNMKTKNGNQLKYKIQDPNIIDKLSTPEELSGLLNLALNALTRLLEQKDFSTTKGCEEIKMDWLRNSSSISAYLIDKIEEDELGEITKHEFRTYYSRYCRKYKLRMVTDKVLKDVLMTTYAVSEERTIGENKARWSGIRFRIKDKDKKCKECKGFYTSSEKVNLDIGKNTLTVLTKDEVDVETEYIL